MKYSYEYFCYVITSMRLYKTTSFRILDEKHESVAGLYQRFASGSSSIIKTQYKGRDYVIAPTALIFFYYPITEIIKKSRYVNVPFNKIKKELNGKQMDDLFFIFNFTDYLKESIVKYEDKYAPLIDAFLKLTKEGKKLESKSLPVRYVNALYRFNAFSSVNDKLSRSCVDVNKRIELGKLNKKFIKIENEIITALNLVAILGIIPN